MTEIANIDWWGASVFSENTAIFNCIFLPYFEHSMQFYGMLIH